jgi:hypothetical protein
MIPNRQIGWSVEATQTWYVANAVERLSSIAYSNPAKDTAYSTVVQSAGTVVTVQGLFPKSQNNVLRNYVSSVILSTDTLGAAGFLLILDGLLSVSSIATGTGLVTTTAPHDLKVGDTVIYNTLTGGTGLTTNTLYYVTDVSSPTTYNISASIFGSNLAPSVAATAANSYRVLFRLRLATTAITSPQSIEFPTPLRSAPDANLNFLIPTSTTSGVVYLTVTGFRGA